MEPPPGTPFGPLRAEERAEAWYVLEADAASEEDWIVRFDKQPEFEAREWATNMVRTYNQRLEEAR